MEIKAKAKKIKMSSRKIRLVADVIRGMETGAALNQLHFIGKLAAKPVIKLINSAVANAENNFELDKDNLYIKEIRVDEGAALKRWMPKAHGRATPIRKKSSHINLILAEIKESDHKIAKKQKTSAPVKIVEKPKENEGIKIKEKRKEKTEAEIRDEKGKKIIDPRMEGRHGHAKIEGGAHRGFVSKIFRRKSG